MRWTGSNGGQGGLRQKAFANETRRESTRCDQPDRRGPTRTIDGEAPILTRIMARIRRRRPERPRKNPRRVQKQTNAQPAAEKEANPEERSLKGASARQWPRKSIGRALIAREIMSDLREADCTDDADAPVMSLFGRPERDPLGEKAQPRSTRLAANGWEGWKN